MAEAKFSKFKKQNLLIFAAACIIFGVWFAYDGYVSEKFIEKHTRDGKPDSNLVFNQKAPYVLMIMAAFFAGRFHFQKNKKITTDNKGLDLNGLSRIEFDNIESVDKTNYDEKGYFIISYKDDKGNDRTLKLSNRDYDGIGDVLDVIISKIS